MSKLIDISPRITERIAVWPGDVAYRREVSLSIEAGHNIGLSAIHSTLHLGAHADAPIHYVRDGAGAGELSLEPYYGMCQVLDVKVAPGARIRPADLTTPIKAPRVLFRTRSFPDPEKWNDDFVSLSPELIDELAARGGVLVGIDTPSVDPFDDKILETHQALARRRMANLEGLVLSHVKPGRYTLVALPLRIEGADASPVRAILVEG